MAVRTKIDPIDRDIDLIFAEELSPTAQSKALATFAREQLVIAQDVNRQALGTTPRFETFVDGQRGGSIESVRPDGAIVFEFELVTDLIEWVEQQLIQHSPQKTGRYSKSHTLLADGVEVQFGATVPPAAEYVFINTQPYARKIERGQSKQAPTGVYQVVAVLAGKRFGNVARVKFGYRVPLFGDVHSWAKKTKMGRKGRSNMKSGARAEWLRRQPAIIITM